MFWRRFGWRCRRIRRPVGPGLPVCFDPLPFGLSLCHLVGLFLLNNVSRKNLFVPLSATSASQLQIKDNYLMVKAELAGKEEAFCLYVTDKEQLERLVQQVRDYYN